MGDSVYRNRRDGSSCPHRRGGPSLTIDSPDVVLICAKSRVTLVHVFRSTDGVQRARLVKIIWRQPSIVQSSEGRSFANAGSEDSLWSTINPSSGGDQG